MSAEQGAAVVHGNTAYFSQGNSVYSYTLAKDEWAKLEQCGNKLFGLAVVNNKVTAIGGYRGGKVINTLLCLEDGTKWRKLVSTMPTPRARPGTVTTSTLLIVAGGISGELGGALPTIEILDTNTHQWFSAISLPKPSEGPLVSLSDGLLYFSEHMQDIFACSVEELLESCKPSSTNSSGSGWTKLADIPVPYYASLTTLRGQVLTIGGSDEHGTPTGTIHRYSRSTNSWSYTGEMPTSRARPLVAVLPSHELIVVGGLGCNNTEIASSTYIIPKLSLLPNTYYL